MNKTLFFLLAAVVPGVLTTSGCTTAVVAGAAAAGGYVAHEKGYRVRNPITKSSESAETKTQ